MIRALQPTDLPRCLLADLEGTRNRVYTRASLGHSPPAWIALPMESARAISRPGHLVAMVGFDDMRIASLAVARQRSGPTSWELSRLQVRTGAEETVGDLVNVVSEAVSARGATQLYARTSSSGLLGEELRRAGLFLSHTETLYRGCGSGKTKRIHPGVRRKGAADEHGLFRLYSAATPSKVRALGGMTLEQWAASRSRAGRFGLVSEYVLEAQSLLVGWLRVVVGRLGKADIAVMLNPECSADDASALLHLGLAEVPEGRAANVLVPDYQTAVRRAAEADLLFAREGLALQVHVRAARATEKILKEVGAYNVVSP